MKMLVDPCKLTNGIIAAIGEAYGMEYDHNAFDEQSYNEYIDSVVMALLVQEVTIKSKKEQLDLSENI